MKLKQLQPNEMQLNNNFYEAIKDQKFAAFINKLKLPEDTLKKRTSLLQKSCEEYTNCANCKSLSECQNEIFGTAYLPKIYKGDISFEHKVCKYKKIQNDKYKHLKNINFINTTNKLKEASFENINKTRKSRFPVITYLVDFTKNQEKKGLFLHGNFGSGKTYLVTATLVELAKKDIKSTIVSWPEFLRDLKASFDTDYDEKFNKVKNSNILLIDDLGAEVVTAYVRDEILFPILEYRMNNNLKTFITSNFTINQLEEHLSISKDGVEKVKSRRIIQRITNLTKDMELVSEDLREG